MATEATVEQTNTQSQATQATETNSEAVKEGLDEKEFKENESKGGNEDQEEESTTTPVDITETKKHILTQVEYYFGNKNLRTDTFLNREMNKDPNGCILEFIVVI